jgi:hypothetical protein
VIDREVDFWMKSPALGAVPPNVAIPRLALAVKDIGHRLIVLLGVES